MMLRRRFLFAKKAVASGISDNEIWYTTTDEKALSSSTNSAFEDDALSSNTYIGGVGKLVYLNVITTIGLNMFRQCTSLQTMVLPSSVESIGNNAYYGCTGFTSIEIPNSVTSIGGSAFYGCTSLTSIEIPNSVTSIGDNTFRSCTSLTSIEIPNSVTSIGGSAFYGCTGFTSITIPDSVTSIGSGAFDVCSRLTSVTIGNSVTSIGNNTFRSCTKLTSVTIPNSVTSVGTEAFAGCTALKGVYITNLEAWCKISFAGYRSNPLYYAYNLYLNGSLVTNLVIPSSITTIKPYAFRACRSITSVTIPNSVKTIDNYAFMHCTSLTNVVIPDSVTSIGGSSFEATTTTSLTELTIGSGVSSIGQNTFKAQTKLTKIYCKATTPPTIQPNTFESVPTSCVVYVPSASVSAYQSATYWEDFTIQGEEQNVTETIRLYYDSCTSFGLAVSCVREADDTTIELYNRLKDIINTHGNPINPMDFGLELYIEDGLITSALDEISYIYLSGGDYGILHRDGRLTKDS